MKYVLMTFVENLQDVNGNHSISEFSILSNKTIQFRSLDHDGANRRYILPISEFEVNFRVNIGDLVEKHQLKFD